MGVDCAYATSHLHTEKRFAFRIEQVVGTMADEEEIKNSELFRALGLQEMDRSDLTVWRQHEQLDSHANDKKTRKTKKAVGNSPTVVVLPNSPWRINDIEIHERKSRVMLAGLSVDLDESRLIARLEAGIKRFYGQRTTGQFVKESGRTHSWWCLLEFVRPGARDELRGYTPTAGNGGLPLGSAGFKFSLAHDGERILVSLTDHFAMGYIPPEFVTGSPRFLAWAFGMGSLIEFGGFSDVVRSLFEVSISPIDIALVAGIHEPEKNSRGSLSHSGFPRKFWELYLSLRGRLVREHVTNGGGFAAIGETFGVKLIAGEGALGSLLGEPVPVEVLESREGGQQLRDLDTSILDGKISKAAKLVENELSDRSSDILYCRRSAFMVLQSVEWRLRDKIGIDEWPAVEVSNKLYLSAKLMQALEKGDNATGLETLSCLGEYLMNQIPTADELRCLDLVLPELLGDLWSGADSQKAAACFKRILLRRGEQPRVLRKLVGLARSADDTVGEIEWLRRLILVEQRKHELARIYLRLAELQADVGDVPTGEGTLSEVEVGSEVLRCGLRALELDRTLHDAAIVVADELVRQLRPLEAIHIVEQLLRETRGAISQKAEARLEARVGRVWSKSMRRPDLAEKRFETALQLDPLCPGALEDLEAIYRETKRFEKLAAIYSSKLETAEKSSDDLESHRILNELVTLYRGPLAQPRKALDLYFRVMDASGLDPLEIDRILAWNDVEVDWQYLHSRILQRVEGSNVADIGRIYCRLALISRDKLNSPELTAKNYRSAFAHNFVDSACFRFLVDDFTAQEDWSQLVILFEFFLAKINGLEKADVSREFLALEHGPNDERRDQLALSLADPNLGIAADKKPLLQRLESYRNENDVGSILRLSETLTSAFDSASEKIEWLKHVSRAVMETNSDAKFEAIDRIFRAMVAAGDDQITVFQSAVEYLCYGPNPKLAFPYAQRLVALHMTPRIPIEAADIVFHGYPRYLAAFYSLVAEGTNDRESATHLYRQAAAELRQAGEGSEDSAITERLLGRICAHSLCEPTELNQLHKLVSRSGNWPILARAITKQAELKDDGIEKAGLLLWLAEIYRNELRDPNRARSSYLQAEQHSDKKYLVRYSLATLEVSSGDQAAAAGYIKDFLSDLNCLDDARKVVAAIKILMDYSDINEKIKPLIKPLLEEAMARGMDSLAGEIGELLTARGVLSLDMIESVFAAKISAGNQEEAAGVWLKAFDLLSSSKRTRAWVEKTAIILDKHNRTNLLPKLLSTALSAEFGAKLGRRARRELLVALGLSLFDTDGKRKKSLRVLQEAFVADPTDQRVWIQLYFATQEFGTKIQRRRYLQVIIPRIEKDSRILKSTPLTIESMRAELMEVSDGIDPNIVQRGKELPDPNSRSYDDGTGAGLDLMQKAEGMDFTSVFDAGASESVVRPLPIGARAILASEDADPEKNTPESNEMLNSISENIFGVPEEVAQMNFLDLAKIDPEMQVSELPSLTLVDSVEPQMPLVDHSMPDDFLQALPPAAVEVSLEEILQGSSVNINSGIPLPVAANLIPTSPFELPIEFPGGLSPLQDLPDLPSNSEDHLFKLDFTNIGVLNDAEIGSPAVIGNQVEEQKIDSRSSISGLEPWMAPEVSDENIDISASLKTGVLPGMDLPTGVDGEYGAERMEYSIAQIAMPAPSVVLDKESPSLDAGDYVPVDGNQLTQLVESTSGNSQYAGIGSDAAMSQVLLDENPHIQSNGPANKIEEEVLEWRIQVRENKVTRQTVELALQQAFASEIEKHIALQVLALVSGATDLLQSWHWRVWRKPDEYGYPLAGKDRFPESATPQMLGGSHYRLMNALAPVLVKVHHGIFSLAGLSARMKISVKQIEGARKPLKWDSGYLGSVGFRFFAERIQKRRFLAYNLPGLGPEVFYDGRERSFYIDENYYKSKVPSVLFHKIQGIYWSIKFQYFVPLLLDPTRHIMPVAVELKSILAASGIDKIKSKLGIGSNALTRAIDQTDVSSLRPLIEKIAIDKRDAYAQLWDAMQQHIYMVKIAETLDLVGIMEEITGKDLLAPNKLAPGQIYRLSPHVARLIEFAMKLKV